MVAVFNRNDNTAPTTEAERLNEDYRVLLFAFRYAQNYYAMKEAAVFQRRQFAFGEDVNVIAPTRIGNIAASMQAAGATTGAAASPAAPVFDSGHASQRSLDQAMPANAVCRPARTAAWGSRVLMEPPGECAASDGESI
jgi:hypothetical protein